MTGWRDDLHKYISGIITGNNAKSLAVGGRKDHVHAFFGLLVTTCVADIVGIIKANSSKWINEKKFVKGKFQWQSGYGAFSHSRSQRDQVIQYIMKQKEHHRVKTFKEEISYHNTGRTDLGENILVKYFEPLLLNECYRSIMRF